MTKLAPLRFDPVYIHKPWGGRRLEAFKGELPPGDIGETWDVSAHPQGDSVVSEGPHAGRTLSDLVEEYDTAIVGTRNAGAPFPLMVRYVSSRENLSIQLHPTESYAHKVGEPSGKDEAWYVLDAAPGSFVYSGLAPSTTFADYRDAARAETLADLVVTRAVAPGDFIYIPAGTVHAICAGITLIEFCENSNTTYRLYDYGRNRGLDLDDGEEVVNVDAVAAPHRGLTWRGDGYEAASLCITERFAITKLTIETSFASTVGIETFQVLTCVEGELTVTHTDGHLVIAPGQSVLLPAGLGYYSIEGSGVVLESHTADVRAEREALADLLT